MKRFSLIVPVYKVENYIEKCLLSIKDQIFKDFECLIIDDGSPDCSIEIAKKVIGDDERFKIYHKKNGGLSDARNYGLNLVSGEYVWFIDSDDSITLDSLVKLNEEIEINGSDIICFDMCYEYTNKKNTISKGANFRISNFKENLEIINIDNSANSKIYKREFLKNKFFPKGMWYEDMAVISLWLMEAKKVSYLSDALYNYLQREGSITKSIDERVFDIYKAILIIKNKSKEMGINIDDIIKQRYIDDCLIMTTLRIKDYQNKKDRINYYQKNMVLLNENCPNWFKISFFNHKYSFKQKIIFLLLKIKAYNFVDIIYQGI